MEKDTQDAIEYIKKIKELDQEERDGFIDRLENGADPVELLDEVEDKLQGKLESVFKEAGVELDENDPEYQKKQQEMQDELNSAEKEFDLKIKNIQEEEKLLQDDASRQLDNSE